MTVWFALCGVLAASQLFRLGYHVGRAAERKAINGDTEPTP